MLPVSRRLEKKGVSETRIVFRYSHSDEAVNADKSYDSTVHSLNPLFRFIETDSKSVTRVAAAEAARIKRSLSLGCPIFLTPRLF